MKSGYRFVFVVICLTAALMYTVHLRVSSSRIFYKLRVAQTNRVRLKQILGGKQLVVARLISPASVCNRVNSDAPESLQSHEPAPLATASVTNVPGPG